MKYLNFCISIIFCLISFNLFAQTPKQIEADLLISFRKINFKQEDYDKLAAANDEFADKLKSYIQKHPATITYPFTLLKKEDLDISSSTDGLFRIYSWDTWTGGTMHFFESVFQYKSGVKTFSVLDTPKSEGDNRPNYNKLFTFKTLDRTYYLAVYITIGSTKDAGSGVHIYTIESGKLNDAKLIKTQSGLNDDLSYNYDFFSVVDIPYEKRPTIRFENSTDTIYLPLVDANRRVTNKFIQYRFTGQYFERIKN
jgi:hypothetical protein